MQILNNIKACIEKCASEKMNGELVLRLVYNQGGVRDMQIQRIENIKVVKSS